MNIGLNKDTIVFWISNLLTVRTEDREVARRGRLVGILLLGTTIATLFVSIVNIIEIAISGDLSVLEYLIFNLVIFSILSSALRLNQTGRTRLASSILLVLLNVGILGFEPQNIDRAALLCIIPTGVASFLIYPGISFVFAGLSSLGYTLVYLVGYSTTSYNYYLVIGLLVMALMAWLAATSLEHALHQVHEHARELDRRVTERTQDLANALQREHTEASTTQAILKSIGDGVIVFDQNRRAILVNPAVCTILECREADVLGKTVTRIMGEAVSIEDQAVIRPLIEAQEPQCASFTITWKRKAIAISLAPVKLPTTNQHGVVLVLRDITKEAEVDQMKSEFVSIVSHELRTPITALKGYVDLLTMESSSSVSEMQREFMRIIKTNTDRLSEMANELLDLSGIEAGEVQMQFCAVSLRDTIRTVIQTLERNFDGRDLELRVDIPDTLPDVFSDPGRLTQIITNLLSNAFKYTFEGHVDVTARVVGDQIQVAIADTGIGMTEQDLAKIFTRFFRASTARVRGIPGTGLGLSITRSLIEAHGGRIWVKSAVNQGATFSFTLPILPEALAEIDTTELSSRTRPCVAPKILIVDDELHIAQLFRHQLETAGYNVLITTKGAEVLSLARREQPDLISLDVVMPDMDGFEVLRQLKQDSDTKSIPVIITSVIAKEEKGLDLGAADYLIKPLSDHQLLTSVRRALAQLDNETSS